MDAATLATAMGCSRAVADRYVAAFNAAMLQAGCTTVNRCAMWTAQIGHETMSMRYMREVWGPTAQQRKYDPASGSKLSRDLGNTRVGDGKLFMGHGAIMITGKANHAAVSRWAHQHGYVPTPTYFVDHPDELAGDRYGFLGAVWYWTVARPAINGMCDKGDLTGVTRAINGGTNGLADRRTRWERCLRLGNALLPSTAVPGGGAGPGSVPRLDEGDAGPAVRHVQEWLNHTFPTYSAIDLGPQRYGPQTVKVIAEFQRRAGIRGGDGRNIGPSTAAAMWEHGYRPPGAAPTTAAAPLPTRRPRGDAMYFETPEPTPGTEKWDWPTIRIPWSFDPIGGWGGKLIIKADHGGRGGWIHLLRWWIRDKNWTPERPLHFAQDHPVGASRGHAGSERFVGYGWESAPPLRADFLEIVTSAPDGVVVRDFYEK